MVVVQGQRQQGRQRAQRRGGADRGGGDVPGRARALPLQGARRAAHTQTLQGLPAQEGKLQVNTAVCVLRY